MAPRKTYDYGRGGNAVIPAEMCEAEFRRELKATIQREKEVAKKEHRKLRFSIASLDRACRSLPGATKNVVTLFLKGGHAPRVSEVVKIADEVGLPLGEMLLWVQCAADGAHCSHTEWERARKDAAGFDHFARMYNLRGGLLGIRQRYVRQVLKNGL